jgi:hypothetical protein
MVFRRMDERCARRRRMPNGCATVGAPGAHTCSVVPSARSISSRYSRRSTGRAGSASSQSAPTRENARGGSRFHSSVTSRTPVHVPSTSVTRRTVTVEH